MIRLTKIIDFAKPLLPINYRIDGAATIEYARDNSRLMVERGVIVPTLYVSLYGLKAIRVAQETFEQTYEQRFVVYACLDNTKDQTGKTAQDAVFNVRAILLKILLNNRLLDPDSHSISLIEDDMVMMDSALYWHQFTWAIVGRLLPDDGYIENYTDLNEIINTWLSNNPLADQPMAVDDIKNLQAE